MVGHKLSKFRIAEILFFGAFLVWFLYRGEWAWALLLIVALVLGDRRINAFLKRKRREAKE